MLRRSSVHVPPLALLLGSLAYMALSAGLMTRFNSSTARSTLIGLQVLFSACAGTGAFQATTHELQRTQEERQSRVPSFEHMMARPSVALFAEMLGGSVGISLAQLVFVTRVARGANARDPRLAIVLQGGVTNFKAGFSPDQLATVMGILNDALTRSFYVSTAAGAWPYGVAVVIGGLLTLYAPWFAWSRYHRKKYPPATSSLTATNIPLGPIPQTHRMQV
jgi:hypothetical protein